jgi:uncharacterized membrane protein
MKPKAFIDHLDHDGIVAAIRGAEARCRGEIRVHVANRKVDDAQKAAAEQFEKLGMTGTAERNGVLIYVAPASQSFAVIGDSGIHEKCGEPFWRDVASAMEGDFREGRFTDGILKGIARAGEALAAEFPRTEAPDANELPDEVTRD